MDLESVQDTPNRALGSGGQVGTQVELGRYISPRPPPLPDPFRRIGNSRPPPLSIQPKHTVQAFCGHINHTILSRSKSSVASVLHPSHRPPIDTIASNKSRKK